MVTGWIQITASLGLIAGLLVILGTRGAVGEAAFLEWGWRVPFLVSIVLLIISVWLRFKLSESPAFAKLKEEGEISKAPLREAFTRWDNLKRVLIAFFGIMCARARLVPQLLLRPGVPHQYVGVYRADQRRAGPGDHGRQRAALRVLRLAVRPCRPQAGDARRNAARALHLLSGLPRHCLGRQSGPRGGAGKEARRSPCQPRELLRPSSTL